MGKKEKQFRKDYIGNIRFEFFTSSGSLTIEAWCCTRMCKVITFNRGLRRCTEVRLSDDQWWKLVVPVSYSGFWEWEKRYDSHMQCGPVPSWSTSIMTRYDWYYSSGDGEFPEGFSEMLNGLAVFAAEIENTESVGIEGFLSGYLAGSEA